MRVLCLVLMFAVYSALCYSEEPAGWTGIDLESVELRGAKLFYEPALSGLTTPFKNSFRRFRRKQAKRRKTVERLSAQRDSIVAEVNSIVGSSPEQYELSQRKRVFRKAIKKAVLLLPAKEFKFYLVRKQAVKVHLRKGGTLPGFTYDNTHDEVTYTLEWDEEFRGQSMDIAIPVTGTESGKDEIQSFFAKVSESSLMGYGGAWHEVTELAILSRLRPGDPYFRWFTDGFASAVAARLVRKHVNSEAAAQYESNYDPGQFAELKNRLNLRYWMGKDFSIETPLEKEEHLRLARYAYAMFEADRLIERHGLSCLKRILDDLDDEDTNKTEELFRAIRNVTGENLQKRFKRYQLFPHKGECIKYYAEQNNEALDRKDYPEALSAMLRILEFRGLEDPRFYSNAAFVLYRMGYEKMGDKAITDHADWHKRNGNKKMHITMHKLFIDYALKCENLSKAIESARIVRKAEPEYVPAMAVHLYKLDSKGRLTEAERIAKRILELQKDRENPWHRIAESSLETIRNQKKRKANE